MSNQQGAMIANAPRRWPFFLAGIVIFFLGIAIYAAQFSLKQLLTPWYVPVLATVGVALMAASVWQRPAWGRGLALGFFALLCAFEWFFILVLARAPAYTGPAQVGTKVPAFSTTLADGRDFTHAELEKGRPTVMLFFRGRW